MTREEATKIVDKIQVYRQSFLVTNNVYQEWYRVLSGYDYEDVDKKLDEYFKNGDNFGRYPDVYYLTKYLKKHDEKLKMGVNYIHCQLCNELLDLEDYNNHYEKCCSVDYLYRMSKKYYDQKLNKEKLWSLSNEEFENKYWGFCKNLIDIMEDGLQKHCLKNAILSHYGQEIECSFESVKGEIKNDYRM